MRDGRDWVKADGDGKVTTTDDPVFAGGDVTNLALVTTAIGQGRQAAAAIGRLLTGDQKPAMPEKPKVTASQIYKDHWLEMKQPTVAEEHIAVAEALAEMARETTRTFSDDEAKTEAARCMSCGDCLDCENCFKFCQDNAVVRPLEKGGEYKFKLENCIGCDKCAEVCPCGYIDMA